MARRIPIGRGDAKNVLIPCNGTNPAIVAPNRRVTNEAGAARHRKGRRFARATKARAGPAARTGPLRRTAQREPQQR